MKVITNSAPMAYDRNVQGQDYIGSIRNFVEPSSIDDEHVLLTDSFFAWNSLAVQAINSPVEVFVTISNPAKLDSALWIPLSQAPGCPEYYAGSNNVPTNSVMMFAYECPITAFKFRCASKYRVEFSCKSPA